MVSKIDNMEYSDEEDEIEIVDGTSSEEDEIEIVDGTSSEEDEIEIVDDEEDEIEIVDDVEIIDDEDELYLDETTSSISSFLSESLKGDQESILKNERLGRLEVANKEEVPLKFITKLNGEFVNIINLLDPDKDIIQNSNILISNNIKLRDNYDMFYIFYRINKDKSKEYIVENFNNFGEKLNLKKYYLENFDSDIEKFESQNAFLMERTQLELKKYNDFYSKIENFKNTDSYESVIDSLTVSNTEAEYKVMDGKYDFDKENMKIIFNKLRATVFFTYIRMDLPKNKKYYKVHIESNKKIENFIDVEKKIEHSDYKIYLFYEVGRKNVSGIYSNYVIFDFLKSSCTINYFENTKDILKQKIKNILPDIIFYSEEEKNIEGDFRMTIKNYDETKFYYLTHFSDIFSEFFYIREVDSLRSLKETLKIYFVGTEEQRQYLNYTVYFNIKKLYNDKYIIKFNSKTSSVKNIKEFITIMIKLFWYFDNLDPAEISKLQFVENPYTGVNGNGLGGQYEDKVDTSQREKIKKIESLMMKEPELFQKSIYVRTCPCPKQPIIIDEKDVKDWQDYEVDGKKRNVVLFPPKESQQKVTKNYYVCPDDEYPNFSLRENPDTNSEFPVIPCCTVSKTTESEEYYKDYEKILQDPVSYWETKEKYKGKNINILKSFKILTSERLGNLPDEITFLLGKVEKDNYLREGVYKTSRSSFLHCVLKAAYENLELLSKIKVAQQWVTTINGYYKNNNLLEKDKRVKMMRNNIVRIMELISREQMKEHEMIIYFYKIYYDISICNQELYGYTRDEIKDIFLDSKRVIDSKKIFRYFENAFLVNIFVFVYDKNKEEKVYLEIPRNKNFHLRNIKENLPSIFLLRHKRKFSYDVYELIRRKDGKKKYLFPPAYSKFMKKYLEVYNVHYTYHDNILRKNFYNNFDWSVILKNYLIYEQITNTNGRTMAFSFYDAEDKKEEKITVFVDASVPFSCIATQNIYKTSKKRCIEIFGNNYKVGSEGLWYPMNEKEFGFFVVCEDVPKKDKYICDDYQIIKNINYKDRELENFIICSWNTNIIINIIKWIYLLEREETDIWFEKYVIKDKDMSEEGLVSHKFKVPLRFPSDITSTKESIKYFSSYIPEMFDKSIYMYPDLYDNTRQYIRNFDRANEGITIKNNKVIKNIFMSEGDYDNNVKFNRIFTENDFRVWCTEEIKDNVRLTEIKDEYVNIETDYKWKNINTGKIYIIKNNIDNSLKVSLFNCLFRKMFPNRKINYNLTEYNLWKIVRDNYKQNNFGWTFQKLNDYIKNMSGQETKMKNEMECLDYLIKNNVIYEFSREYSYIVYSHSGNLNNPISISEKHIYDDDEPFEIYIYTDGGFCSMFPIS